MRSSSLRNAPEAHASANPAPAPRAWLLACAALAITALAYVSAVGGPFIWDDRQLIVDSPKVSALRPVSEYFGSAFWLEEEREPGGRSYYRPLTILSLALDHRVHGMNPGGFHLTNVLLHLGCTLVLFTLLRRRGVAPVGTFVLTLGWSLFPRLTEDVAWIAGRTDVLATLFVLLALLIATTESNERAADEAGWRSCLRSSAAALTILAGLLAKEVAVAGLLALLVLEISVSRAQGLFARLGRLSPYVAVSAGYFLLRARALPEHLVQDQLEPLQRARATLEAAGRYASMVLNPWRPDIQIGSLSSIDSTYATAGALVLVGVGLALWFGRRRLRLEDPCSQAVLTLALVSIGLVLHVIPIPVTVVAADRFLYLPLAGSVLLVAPLIRERRSWGVPVKLATAALLASFTTFTALRASTWADEASFWVKALQQQGDTNGMAHLELGNVYFRAGLLDEALSLWLNADRINPEDCMAINNVGIGLTSAGQYSEATVVFEEATARGPWLPVTHINSALTAVTRGRFDDAERSTREALRLYPDYQHAKAVLTALPALKKLSRDVEVAPKTLEQLVERARGLAELTRSSEAMLAWLAVARDPTAGIALLEEGMGFALRRGDVISTQAMFAMYERRAQPGPDDPLRIAYAVRSEQAQRLRQAWPELGIALTRAATYSRGQNRANVRADAR